MKNLLVMFVCVLLTFAGNTQNADSAARYYQLGLTEKQNRRFREAEKNFAKAAQFSPTDSKPLIELGNSLTEQNRYMEAKAAFVKAEAINAQDPVIVENLALLSLNTRHWNDAIKYAQKMKQLKSGKENDYIIAKSNYELENFGEALKYCELAFKAEPRRAEIPYIAARCFVEMSNYKRAAGCYDQAIERDSSKVNWMYEAGLVAYAVPDDKKAIYWFELAGSKGYNRSNDYIENLGNAYLNIGNYDKGVALLEEILKRKPEDQEVLYNVADAYYRGGKYQKAIDYWDQVLTIDKKNASALYMIGLSYQKKGEKEKGAQLCDRAIQMDPSLKNLKQERKMPGGI
jgi:tetratricopeptide (TPR) repeat protein